MDRQLPRVCVITIHAGFSRMSWRHVMSLSSFRLALTVAFGRDAHSQRFAQGAPPTDLHHYPLPTYEEDWRAASGGATAPNIWDPVKFVPLSADGNDFALVRAARGASRMNASAIRTSA